MLQNALPKLLTQLIGTSISAVIIFIIAIIIYILLSKKSATKKQLSRLKSRTIYIAIVVFLLVLIKIWVEGFTHLLTVLSLIGAGLVITNKENIMNFTGWIIINWRGLFSEKDHIQVTGYAGVVSEIKLFYFYINETSSFGANSYTGKLIKLPNALIITNPITTLLSEQNLILHKVTCTIAFNHHTLSIADQAQTILNQKLNNGYYHQSEIITKPESKSKKLKTQTKIPLPKVEIKFIADKDSFLHLQASFYCYSKDAASIEKDYTYQIITYINKTT